jgi:hypothetical protein
MGIFSFLFKRSPKTINLEDGLDYRVVNNFKIEVIIGQEFRDAYEGSFSLKPTREYVATIRRLNMTATLANDGEAYAVSEVALGMDHFCEACGDLVTTDDKKCDSCGAKLWKWKQPIEVVVVHV